MRTDSSALVLPPGVHRLWLGKRRLFFLALAAVTVLCFFALDLKFGDLIVPPAYLKNTKEFFSAAFSPALNYQDAAAAATSEHILTRAASGALTMIRVAAGALALALPTGLALAYLSSRSWWENSSLPKNRRILLTFVSSAARTLATFLRSVHELLWAILFLASLGLTELTGTIAIAIPFAGTFAKVFGEMFDEQDLSTANYLEEVGASPLAAFTAGIFPRAFPDLLSYTFYRFECALRSSAVIGFFGVESLGLYIRQSTENLYFNETWTYLYTLIALLVLFEIWNVRIRAHLLSVSGR